MTTLPRSEFVGRINNIRSVMLENNVDIFLVYGDEYRREHLRYVSNYWPIFERGMLVIAQKGDPILLAAPECLNYAKEMSAWSDIRIVHEMEMAYVSDQILYTSDNKFSTLEQIFTEILNGKAPKKIMVCGVDAMSSITLDAIKSGGNGADVINADHVIYGLRLLKSPAEINMLNKVWEICDIGYKAVLGTDLVGLTERQAAAIGEMECRKAGAESVVFSIFACGERTNTVIGRATERVIRDGDLVMYSLAVQYEGYIASDGWPFAAGNKPTPAQFDLTRHLLVAEDIGIQMIHDGVVAGEVIQKIRDYFQVNGLSKYDLYPPIHGSGLAEAESPYPDENTRYPFQKGMSFNFDVSLFGIPGVGSNRVEEGFVISENGLGLVPLSGLIDGLRKDFMKKNT